MVYAFATKQSWIINFGSSSKACFSLARHCASAMQGSIKFHLEWREAVERTKCLHNMCFLLTLWRPWIPKMMIIRTRNMWHFLGGEDFPLLFFPNFRWDSSACSFFGKSTNLQRCAGFLQRRGRYKAEVLNKRRFPWHVWRESVNKMKWN